MQNLTLFPFFRLIFLKWDRVMSMKYSKSLNMAFFNKEKIFIFIVIFILLNMSLYVVFFNSVYCQKGYGDFYPNAGLEFFYYIHAIGMNPYHFICLMLLLPNILSADFLSYHISHTHYPIETRITKKAYYRDAFIKNIIYTFITILIFEILTLLIIHFFYKPIRFNTMVYPDSKYYHAMTILLFQNEVTNLITFVFLTALGYSAVSSLLFSFQYVINNPFVYRCSGVIIGILLILIPALIQGYLPFPDLAFLIQVSNIVSLGVDKVRENPFLLSYPFVYLYAFLIYAFVSGLCFSILLKRRYRDD